MAIRVPSRTRQRRFGYVHLTPLVCPVLSSPADEATVAGQTSATLSWAQTDGATSYNVYVWATAGSEPSSPTANTTSLTYNATGLSAETGYTWRVNPLRGTDEKTGCEERQFTTASDNDVEVNYTGAGDDSGGPFSLALDAATTTAFYLAATMTGTAVDTVTVTLDGAFTVGSGSPSTVQRTLSWSTGETGQKVSSPFLLVPNSPSTFTITASNITGTAALGNVTTGTIFKT